MTLFTIPNDTKQYHYPEANEDIKLGDYLHYLEHIAPGEPGEVAVLRAAHAKLEAISEDVHPWMDKAKIDRDADAEEIAQGLEAWLNSDLATNKAKKLLPQLLLEWNKAQNEASETLEGMGTIWYATKMLPYMCRVVAHFTGLPLPRLLGKEGPAMHVKTVEFLYGKITRAIEPREQYEYKQAYIVDGDAYELPERLMTNSTVIEFAEAAQFQENAARLRNGHILSLIDVCAVLLRKAGEAYSDEVYHRNRETFRNLTLAQALEIAFFLMKQSEAFASDFLTSTAQSAALALPKALRN